MLGDDVEFQVENLKDINCINVGKIQVLSQKHIILFCLHLQLTLSKKLHDFQSRAAFIYNLKRVKTGVVYIHGQLLLRGSLSSRECNTSTHYQ